MISYRLCLCFVQANQLHFSCIQQLDIFLNYLKSNFNLIFDYFRWSNERNSIFKINNKKKGFSCRFRLMNEEEVVLCATYKFKSATLFDIARPWCHSTLPQMTSLNELILHVFDSKAAVCVWKSSSVCIPRSTTAKKTHSRQKVRKATHRVKKNIHRECEKNRKLKRQSNDLDFL